MASIRISKGLQSQIVSMAVADTKYAKHCEVADFLGDATLKELLSDMAGGEDKYQNMDERFLTFMEKLDEEFNTDFLSYMLAPFDSYRNNLLRKVREGEYIHVYLKGTRNNTGWNQRHNSIVLKVQNLAETPYAPGTIYLEEQSVDLYRKWSTKFEEAVEKANVYREGRNKFIFAMNNLLAENNTTAKLNKNCPELVKYLNRALAASAGVATTDKNGKVSDKSDLKVVLSELK